MQSINSCSLQKKKNKQNILTSEKLFFPNLFFSTVIQLGKSNGDSLHGD